MFIFAVTPSLSGVGGCGERGGGGIVPTPPTFSATKLFQDTWVIYYLDWLVNRPNGNLSQLIVTVGSSSTDNLSPLALTLHSNRV